MIGAVLYTTNDFSAKIYPAGCWNKIDWNANNGKGFECNLGDSFSVFDFKKDEELQNLNSFIEIAVGMDENFSLRLRETKEYTVKLEAVNEQKEVSVFIPYFQNECNKLLKKKEDRDYVTFQFINYLGRSKITFGKNENSPSFEFEVVPDKMNYEDDYIRLTECIAQNCSELLLEYSGATSNRFTLGDTEPKTLLEQFIFLRQFCYSENLQSLFEAIKRNPARELVTDELLKPFGSALPSGKFYSNPFSYSRGWNKFGDTYMPEEIAVTQKHDSLDTPANRFIKYALQKFNSLCCDLIRLLSENGGMKQAEVLTEAKQIRNLTDDILQDSFFDDVGFMDLLPQNNQILQKREGYAQIFSAVSMIDLALQLDWKGKDQVYNGESKNVALLYEYYLFFELYRIIKSISSNCKPVEVTEDPFVSIEGDELTISLCQDKKSCQSFELSDLQTKINLYYNRTFSHKDFDTTVYEGSYSRPFRPDYTLAVFPSFCQEGKYNGEEEAVKKGLVSFIHFDAKYRITDLTAFIRKDESQMTEAQKEEAEKKEVEEDKSDSITNTYKRGDLLKMHTYNDAIRRTIGSYVLYPGSDASNENNHFKLYEELLPGVGAFAIKPSIQTESENALKNFIFQLIMAKSRNYTRLGRMNYYSNEVLQEPGVINTELYNDYKDKKPDEKCILGYIRADSEKDYYYFLKENHLMENGKDFYFYYYAIKDGYVYSHHKDIALINNFRFYTNPISKTGTYQIESVFCKVIDRSLVSKQDLIELLHKEGYESPKSHRADFYYVLHLVIEDVNKPVEPIRIEDVESVYGNDTFSSNSPKVIDLPEEIN